MDFPYQLLCLLPLAFLEHEKPAVQEQDGIASLSAKLLCLRSLSAEEHGKVFKDKRLLNVYWNKEDIFSSSLVAVNVARKL